MNDTLMMMHKLVQCTDIKDTWPNYFTVSESYWKVLPLRLSIHHDKRMNESTIKP